MEEKIDNSDKSLLKGISLFGGVQIFQVLISVIRGKFVAMFLLSLLKKSPADQSKNV